MHYIQDSSICSLNDKPQKFVDEFRYLGTNKSSTENYVKVHIGNHHHHHITLVARISLTLSCHSSLSFIALGRSSGQHPVSSHSC